MSKKMVTLNELLEIKDFAERVTLVNKHGNLNNQITHVTIMEGPDLHEWVTGGEFVLTTWYAFSKSPDLQEDGFKKLAPRISAIGIKTGRFINKIPLKILQLADQYRLPVFEVKTAVKFRELVQTITSEIQNYQTNMLIEVEKNYQKLIHTSLNSDDLASLVNVLGNQLHKNCFCLNHEGKILVNRIFLIGQKKLKLVLMKEYILMRAFLSMSCIFSNAMPVVSLLGGLLLLLRGS